MYNWRTLSFLTFGSMFWLISTSVATGVWLALSSRSSEGVVIKKEEDVDSGDGYKESSEPSTAMQEGVTARLSPDIKAEEEDEPSAYGSNEDNGLDEGQGSELSGIEP